MRLLIIILSILTLNFCSKGQVSQREVKLDLSGQHLKEIPDSVYQNHDITYLDLGSKEIRFYPPLSGLTDNNSNEISYLSDEIGKLKNLKVLILNTNKLTALPNSITKLINLEVLDLSINKDLNIVHQLDKLRQLPKLKILKVVDIQMTKDDMKVVKSALRPDLKLIMTVQDYIESPK